MYDYFDKHGKKLLAVVGSLLVLVFLLPAGFNGRGGGGSGRFGKVDGHTIDPDEVERAQSTLRSLDRLVTTSRGPDGQPTQMTVPQALFGSFGRNTLPALQQNPVLAYLLMNEAAEAGAVPDDGRLDAMLNSRVQFAGDNGKLVAFDTLPAPLKDALRNDFRRLVSVLDYFNRIAGVIKISKPLVDDQLARQTQQIKARVAVFDSAKYDNQVTTPTADDLKRQFDAYANEKPTANELNPFGFGYKVPDRIGVQWLQVSEADAAKAVVATKSPELWEEDAIIYYQRHTQEFTKTVPPATQPTTQPFAAVKGEVLKALQQPLIDQKKRAVANRIAAALSSEYQKASKSPATQEAVTNYGVAFGSFDYLQKLCDDLQKQTGVRPTAVAPAGLLSQDDLQKQAGFGQTMVTDPALGFAPGSQYLFDNVQAFHPSAQPSAITLRIGQPSIVLESGSDLYVARVVSAESAHAAKSLDDVKAQVEKDVRRAQAYKIAESAAQATLDKANKAGGLEKSDVAVQTSDWFSSDSPAPAGLTGDYVGRLVGPAFEALRGVAAPAALPVRSLAKLRQDGKAAVIEVFDVKTDLNTANQDQFASMAEQELAQGAVTRGLVEQWFSFDAVSKRTNYVPETPRETPGPNAPRNNPANPFLPG